ncbi:pilus assembly protein [Selenomonas caprae]|uniref:Pilus assembly protein n=1 Tax=Selenomonas caprae TaxID=2606905 RepID=A0A5D6WQ71_9FIRM|nr:TadE family protein [Selenomonas caprae]TYZ29259.1 pilus assembly protein [Selenomonas caprae]
MQQWQRGQGIVEFALVLPLFCLLVFGIVFAGMMFADYMTLANIARSSARAAAKADAAAFANRYKLIRDDYQNQSLPLGFFTWDPKDEKYFKIEYDRTHSNVIVKMYAPINTVGSTVANVVNYLTSNKNDPINLQVTYTMYSENKH